MNNAHRASQFPAKSLRWHKLVPVGTTIAEGSVDLAPLPLIFVPQGRWVTSDQLDSGHLLLQDDETDRYTRACWRLQLSSSQQHHMVTRTLIRDRC